MTKQKIRGVIIDFSVKKENPSIKMEAALDTLKSTAILSSYKGRSSFV